MEERNTKIEEIVAHLIVEINKLLSSFALKFSKKHPCVKFETEDNSNESLRINSFLNASERRDGLQVSVCVTFEVRDKYFKLSSDIVYENGTVIAIGPSEIFDNINLSLQMASDFLRKLNAFIDDNEENIVQAAVNKP